MQPNNLNQPQPTPPTRDPFQPVAPTNRKRLYIYLASALVVVLIGVGIYIRGHHNLKPSTVSVAPPPTGTVTITDDGFIPATLLVKPTTKITWHNSAKDEHQVSIDTYTGESKTLVLSKGLAIRAADDYLLQFNQVGTYLYSDPLHPALKGEIQVK